MNRTLVELLGEPEAETITVQIAPMRDTIFADQPLLTFETIYAHTTSKQKQLIIKLLQLKPKEVGRNMPFYGIEEPTGDVEFELLTDDFKEGEKITRTTRAVPKPIFKAFTAMNNALQKDHKSRLIIGSAYRPPAYQALLIFHFLHIYKFNVERVFSRIALPGYSEHGLIHQTALDLDYTFDHPEDYEDQLFAERSEYKWLLKHAGDFDFRLSYPPDNPQKIDFEPWHWRYMGQ